MLLQVANCDEFDSSIWNLLHDSKGNSQGFELQLYVESVRGNVCPCTRPVFDYESFFPQKEIYTIFLAKKWFPVPGIEPGPRGWEPRILATRPHGTEMPSFEAKLDFGSDPQNMCENIFLTVFTFIDSFGESVANYFNLFCEASIREGHRFSFINWQGK